MVKKPTVKQATDQYVSSLSNTGLLRWLVLLETKTITPLKNFTKEVVHEWLDFEASACYEGRLASSILKVLKRKFHKRFKKRQRIKHKE